MIMMIMNDDYYDCDCLCYLYLNSESCLLLRACCNVHFSITIIMYEDELTINWHTTFNPPEHI